MNNLFGLTACTAAVVFSVCAFARAKYSGVLNYLVGYTVVNIYEARGRLAACWVYPRTQVHKQTRKKEREKL